jgi:hypothetical protein
MYCIYKQRILSSGLVRYEQSSPTPKTAAALQLPVQSSLVTAMTAPVCLTVTAVHSVLHFRRLAKQLRKATNAPSRPSVHRREWSL